MFRSQISAFAVLLYLGLTNAMGQAGSPQVPLGTGRISGRVFRADTGKPLAGVNVMLGRTPQAADIFMQKKTSADGTYKFSGLVSGNYTIVADHPDFARSVYGMDPHLGGWTPLTLRSGETRINIDIKLHPYAKITQMDRETLPTSLPAGYYGVGPGIFSPAGKLIAFALGDPAPEQAWLYDRVSHRVVNVTGGREGNGSIVSLQMAWIGDTLYVQIGNTATQRHFFVATATGAKEIQELPPEAANALKRQQDSGVGSALNSGVVNRSVVKAENLGSGLFNLIMEALDGRDPHQIASGSWELESFVIAPDRSSILYLETFPDWDSGDTHDSAIMTLNLNTRQSQETYLPARAEKLLAAVQEGDGYLAAFTTYGPCEPEALLGGRHQAKEPPKNVCFAKVPIRANH